MEFLGYYNFYYWLKAKLKNIRYFPREVKWKIQRVKRGYSDCDVWGFDYYLVEVILGGLKHLRKNKCGYPVIFPAKDGDPNHIDEKKNLEEWNRILDTMIYAFEVENNILNGDPIWYYIPSKKWTKKEYEERKKQFESTIYVMTYEECKKFEEGWSNFQKHFHNLWD